MLTRAEPAGPHDRIPQLETLRPGEAVGILVGGTLTQLLASLGTPYRLRSAGTVHILFIDEVAERPYRLDRMLTQLRFAGLLAARAGRRVWRAAAM